MADVRLDELTSEGAPFVAGTTFDLADVGYVQGEYSCSGTAHAFTRASSGVAPDEEADFSTRLLVYRPARDADFDGTVWVEWLNVTSGFDAATSWLIAHREMVRRGAAWVGVSAQHIGVMGGSSIMGFDSAGLIGIDAARYGRLQHPGDRFSYDIYAQVSAAVLQGGGTILDTLLVERVIGVGESQSAARLTTYVKDVDPVLQVHDGFLLLARGGSAPALVGDSDVQSSMRGEPVLFDPPRVPRVPTLCVESETDLIELSYLTARQDDTDSLVTWEMAGTAHADVYTFAAGFGDDGMRPIKELAAAWRPTAELFGMPLDLPMNAGPKHYVVSAAASALDHWVRHGSPPAQSARLAVRDGVLLTDDHGNVLGGVRTPHVDVPVARLSGLGNSGHPTPLIASLCGTTVAFDDATLGSLYQSRADYLDRFTAAAARSVAAGFLLADDVAEIVAIAEINSPL